MKNGRSVSLGLCTLFFALLAAPAIAFAEPSPLYWFNGLDLGYGSTSARALPERTIDGTQVNLKTLASFYDRTLPFVYDAAFGWQWGSRSGDYANRTYVKTITRGFYIELQGRWIFSPNEPTRYASSFSAGPLLLASFSNDLSLGDGNFDSGREHAPVYLGVQGMYEVPGQNEWIHRFGMKLAVDVNVPDRTAFLGQLTYQVGFPVLGYLFRDPKARIVTLVHQTRALKRFHLVLDARSIEFDTNRASLRADSHGRIEAAARFLHAHQNEWERLIVSGHTDERGTVPYNQTLSEERARTVRAALVSAGIPGNRITTRGFSENRPLVNGHDESAWARNRRVEFDFSGVTSLEVLSRGLFEATTVEGRETPDGD